ncbi:TNNC2 [Symbiodinium sp. CCMP2592]|nr:TNNC2 [Symbiodinium sp. CCMP2592]
MDQRRKLLFAYKVRSTRVKTGQHSDSHTGRSSKVPLLPDLEAQRGVLNSTSDVHRSVPGMAMTSSVLKLPILPDSKLSDTEALVLAAATASQSMSALPFSSKSLARFGMSRSASEAMLPKRRTARNQILEKLALSSLENTQDLGTSSGSASRFGRALQEPRRRDSFKEKSALLQITRAAQEICLQLSEQRQDECVDGKGSGQKTGQGLGRNKKQPRSKQKGKKKEVAEEAQIQLEAWCRSTLASVPEADEATKSAAELRKKQLEEMNQADTEAAGEPANSGMDKRSIRPAAEDATGSTAPSPKSRRPVSKQGKKLTQQFSTKWKTLGRDDASYGLPNLQDRLEQIQNTYFGKADMMDEATVQRMRMVFNRFRNSTGNEILQDDLPHAMEFLGYVVTSEEELNQVAGQVTSFKEMDFNEFLEFVEKYSRAQFDLYQVVFDRFDCDGSGEIEISELRKLLLSIGIVVVRQMIEEALEVVDDDGNGQLNFEEFIYFLTVYQHTEGFTKEEVKRMWDIYSGFVAESVKLKRGQQLQIDDLKDALVAVFGLHSESHAVRIAHKLCNNANGQKRQFGANEGLSFHEFLIFARGLRIAEQAEYKRHFKRFDQDSSGNISATELRDVLQALGYRPMRQVIGEVLEEVDFEHDAELDFEEFFHFMLLFKQRDGFSQKELTEYADVFRKFDRDESDNINVHELGDMLRFLGFSVGTDHLYILLAQVDVNRNGTLDCNEFLRLMRLHRETELKRLHDIFVHRGVAQETLEASSVPTAVQDYVGRDVPLNTLLPELPPGSVSAILHFAG